MSMLGTLIASFVTINGTIVIFSLLLFVYQTETKIQEIIEHPGWIEQIQNQETYNFGFSIEQTDEYYITKLPNYIQNLFPLKESEAYRNIGFPNLSWKKPWYSRIFEARYNLFIPYQEYYLHFKVPMAQQIKAIILLLGLLTIFEVLYLISRLSKNHKKIRESLYPLLKLADSMKSLQDNTLGIATGNQWEEIKTLTTAISRIDAQKLESDMGIDSNRNELKDLTLAINDMLIRIRQSYEAQSRFVSDASHELRTPLAVIQGYVNLLDRWGKNDPKTRQESIDAIKEESDHMKNLIEQLLFLARGDSESISLHKEIFQINQLIVEVCKEMEMIDDSIPFIVEAQEDLWIEADRQLIKQVIRILIDNGMKYSQDCQPIKIKIFKTNHQVHVQIQDQGIGIKTEDLPNIFNRFYRSEQSRHQKISGSGLGLSIAQWIIEKHEGSISVISRVELGTRVTFCLDLVTVD